MVDKKLLKIYIITATNLELLLRDEITMLLHKTYTEYLSFCMVSRCIELRKTTENLVECIRKRQPCYNYDHDIFINSRKSMTTLWPCLTQSPISRVIFVWGSTRPVISDSSAIFGGETYTRNTCFRKRFSTLTELSNIHVFCSSWFIPLYQSR